MLKWQVREKLNARVVRQAHVDFESCLTANREDVRRGRRRGFARATDPGVQTEPEVYSTAHVRNGFSIIWHQKIRECSRF